MLLTRKAKFMTDTDGCQRRNERPAQMFITADLLPTFNLFTTFGCRSFAVRVGKFEGRRAFWGTTGIVGLSFALNRVCRTLQFTNKTSNHIGKIIIIIAFKRSTIRRVGYLRKLGFVGNSRL